MNKEKLTLFLSLLGLLAIFLPTQAYGLVPYPRSIFDMIDDPFRILEHSPLSVPRAVPDENAVALARADWKETPQAHVISLDVPGMKKDDIKIEVEDNRVLRVSGERRTEEEEVKDERWHRVERTVGKFWRQFRLPANADLENVGAKMENGVLRIAVPKLADSGKKKEPKVISIAGGNDENGKIGSGDDVIKASKHEL